jgi:hypothetical protein
VDFVVFGCGFGALLMLLGFALRDLGPWLFGTTPSDEALPEFEGAKATIRKQTLATIGTGISFAGAGIAAVTFAALLASADDRMGAMVVGISVILATVGVAAWSYDAYRRYRGAMTIVYAQERATRSRQAGKSKRTRQARPRQETIAASGAAAPIAPAESVASPADTSVDEEQPEDLDAPLLDWHSTRLTTPVVANAEDNANFPIDDEDIEASDEAEPIESDVYRYDESTSDIAGDTEEDGYAWPEIAPWNRDDDRSNAGDSEDALIEESTRVDAVVPSWLFDDLDADITHHRGAGADPIDQFHEAKPVTRASALERLLANDDEEASGDSPSADDPRKKSTKP